MSLTPNGRPAPAVRRGSAASLAVPSRKNSVSPDDDYNYDDVGPSPEGSATTERENPVVPELRVDVGATPNKDLGNVGSEKFRPKIYERQAGNRRAKLPDEENPGCNGIHPGDNEERPPEAQSTPKRSIWSYRRTIQSGNTAETDEKGKLRHVMLHWGKENLDGTDGAQRLVINAHSPSVASRSIDSHNQFVWQHSELEDMSFRALEGIVTRSRSQGLQQSDIGLTRRLLKRVRRLAERDFIGGSFLFPLAQRYEYLDDSRYSVDKYCIFLSFPYFAVAEPYPTKPYKKGNVEHPVRTLLQSRYRLNETVERDKFQCIRRLKREALKACINATDPECAQTLSKRADELVHVPQLWALIIGVDRMITTGPIGDIALQGSSIKIRDHGEMREARGCSLVRISLINEGKLEELTYPIEQCASWFGLLNKHQQIRDILKRNKKKADPDEYDPKDFKLEIGGHVIDGGSWTSVQQSTQTEVLDIWMRTSKRKGPKVSIQMDGYSNSASAQYTEDEPIWDEREPSTSEPSTEFPPLEFIPIVSAFLEWPLLDEFGDPDECPLGEKLNRFLNAIYRSLPVICISIANDSARASNTALGPGVRPNPGARPKISISGKTEFDVETRANRTVTSTTGNHPTIEQKVYLEYRRLFQCFVPKTHDQTCAPIQLFWGALFEVMDHPVYLEQFHEKTKEIVSKAEKIHLGVYHQRLDGNSRPQGTISDSAMLLSSMVNALGTVFNLLVEAVRDVRHLKQQAQPQRWTCGRETLRHCVEACKLLETAKNELIREATGAAAGESIGPVLTPEAILILLMERLVGGVFRDGNVAVINIFEQCLEHLALKVKDRASRRLLQMVNAFEEEVSIVNDVLLQQQKVLLEFWEYLKPSSFKTPSIARKMRFDFEEKGIERILSSIRDQLRDCIELRDRAKVLAIQNVQLVETLQDDNGRAIFIFTFITVLFLPLTFVAGFFGMNLAGISGTKQTSMHFWYIALPVTAAIMVICAAVVFEGEELWFALKLMPRNTKDRFRKMVKRKKE